MGETFSCLRQAFFLHWNLLFMGASSAAAVIVGHTDVFLPLLAAGEILYLALVATSPRLQQLLRSREITPSLVASESDRIQKLLDALKKGDQQHFENLKKMCLKLQTLTEEIQRNTQSLPTGFSDLKMQEMNRLLWLYLKLLYAKNMMESFLGHINVREIEADIQRSTEQLAALPTSTDPNSDKRRQAIEDTLETSKKRQQNYQRTKEKYDLIGVEQDRLYAKIAGLVELGFEWQNLENLTGEIDLVSTSLHQTEATLREIEGMSSLTGLDDDAPPMLLTLRQ